MASSRKPSQLSSLQEKIMYYHFGNRELSWNQIAKDLDVEWKTVAKALKHPLCVAKEAELKAKTDDSAIMGRRERLETLTTIARADITDVVSPDGAVTITPGKTMAIEGYSVTKGPRGVTQSKIKMYSKLTAIELIAKIEGDLKDSQTINNNNIVVIREVEVRLMGNSVRAKVIDCGSGNTNPSLP